MTTSKTLLSQSHMNSPIVNPKIKQPLIIHKDLQVTPKHMKENIDSDNSKKRILLNKYRQPYQSSPPFAKNSPTIVASIISLIITSKPPSLSTGIRDGIKSSKIISHSSKSFNCTISFNILAKKPAWKL